MGRFMADECGIEGIGDNPPKKMDGKIYDAILDIAGTEVALNQLSSYLAMACSLALEKGIRPATALTEAELDPMMSSDLPQKLDEYGMIYDAHRQAERNFHSAIKSCQLLARSFSSDSGNPMRMTWDLNNDIGEQTLHHMIAKEAFELARTNLISAVTVKINSMREF
jgi:hypothetical protein